MGRELKTGSGNFTTNQLSANPLSRLIPFFGAIFHFVKISPKSPKKSIVTQSPEEILKITLGKIRNNKKSPFVFAGTVIEQYKTLLLDVNVEIKINNPKNIGSDINEQTSQLNSLVKEFVEYYVKLGSESFSHSGSESKRYMDILMWAIFNERNSVGEIKNRCFGIIEYLKTATNVPQNIREVATYLDPLLTFRNENTLVRAKTQQTTETIIDLSEDVKTGILELYQKQANKTSSEKKVSYEYVERKLNEAQITPELLQIFKNLKLGQDFDAQALSKMNPRFR